MQLSNRQRAIIVGTLLGDGCLERNGRNVRLRIEHGITQESYVLWKHKELKSLITGRPMNVHAFHKKNQCFYDSLRIYTFSDSTFEFYWNSFYPNRKKVLPLNISELLTEPLSVAVWFMDDGYKRNDCNALRLSTDSFQQSEQQILCEVLKKNFGIDSTLHKKSRWWNIYIPQKSSKRFVELVKPYIIPSLQYKIALAP
jgi:LAGLIDADG DNA endonuclease family